MSESRCATACCSGSGCRWATASCSVSPWVCGSGCRWVSAWGCGLESCSVLRWWSEWSCVGRVWVGVLLGVAVGIAVGVSLGVWVGLALGVSLGSGVGLRVDVGEKDGVALGVFTGVELALALGVLELVAVAVGLGTSVACSVGVGLGDGVDETPGTEVSVGVGVAVGVGFSPASTEATIITRANKVRVSKRRGIDRIDAKNMTSMARLSRDSRLIDPCDTDCGGVARGAPSFEGDPICRTSLKRGRPARSARADRLGGSRG